MKFKSYYSLSDLLFLLQTKVLCPTCSAANLTTTMVFLSWHWYFTGDAVCSCLMLFLSFFLTSCKRCRCHVVSMLWDFHVYWKLHENTAVCVLVLLHYMLILLSAVGKGKVAREWSHTLSAHTFCNYWIQHLGSYLLFVSVLCYIPQIHPSLFTLTLHFVCGSPLSPLCLAHFRHLHFLCISRSVSFSFHI